MDEDLSGDEILDLLIIGAGPAGLSAGIYGARAGLKTIILTGLQPGGQATLTNAIENYPGFPEGVGGSELGDLFTRQAERFGVGIEYDLAIGVDISKVPFKIQTENRSFNSKTIIIATGANPNKLNIPGETELIGKGVSYCATCDGWFFKNKNISVVGGGDSALEEALFLTKFAEKVTIFHRRDSFRASDILRKRVLENPKIKTIMNTNLLKIVGDEKVDAIETRNNLNGEENIIKCDGVFIFIGHSPNSNLFKESLSIDDKGYIQVDNLMQTNVKGIYAVGEVADPHFKQVITSAGMGAAAAIQANRFLEHPTG